MKCKVINCNNKYRAAGYCSTHYNRLWRNGNLEKHKSWFKAKHNTEEAKKRMSEIKKGSLLNKQCKKCGQIIGKNHRCPTIYISWSKGTKGLLNLSEENGMWRGDKVGYAALHSWIKRRIEKPIFCVKCLKEKPYDLTNISGEYKRDLSDWEWLCRKCHMKSDNRLKNFIENYGKHPEKRNVLIDIIREQKGEL